MTDLDWRKWERECEANPGDRDLLERAIASWRRAGLPIPGWLLQRQIHPPRTFNSVLRFHVYAMLPGGEVRRIGRTPHGPKLQIPEHTVWWVQPEPRLPVGVAEFESLEDTCRELTWRGVPGLVAKRTRITNAVLEQIATCRHLQRLELGSCGMATEEGVAHLAELPLRHLSLEHCGQIEDAGIEALCSLPNLTTLRMTDAARITDAGLAFLRDTNLTELHLKKAFITDAGLAGLSHMPELRVLRLEDCLGLQGGGLSDLDRLPNLHTLSLSGCQRLKREGVALLGGLTNLRVLDLRNCYVSDAGLEKLTALSSLRTLVLGPTGRVTSVGMRSLSRLGSLTHLNLAWCEKIGDLGLVHIMELSNLTYLNLTGSKVTWEGVGALRRLERLRTLELPHCGSLTDQALTHLSKLTNLIRLNLRWCPGITDDGLSDLASLTSLQELDLSFCGGITDAGLERLLGRPNRLTRIRLEGSEGVSDEACERLKESRPSCRFIR